MTRELALPLPPSSSAPRTKSGTVDLAIIVPAFNERDGVPGTVERLRAALAEMSCSYDLVVVDDGSSDATGEHARAAGARVLTLAENRGYGAALKAGIANSTSDLVAIIDADGSYPPEALPRLLSLMANADMVVAARNALDRSIPRLRRPARWVLGMLASYLADQRIPDVNSGLRVMRRSVLAQFLHILPAGFSFTTTITLALLCTGHRVIYEPISCHPRVGFSKLRARDFTSFLMLVLRTVVLFNPLKVFLPLGSLLFLIGAMKFVFDLYQWNLSETAVMSFLAAIVVWSVGLLADMIARLQLRWPGPL